MQQIYTPKQDYKVLVHTITYNQAKYINDTLDGVAMQQTNFPFVHYVIDDCSTDGEQEVIKSWINDHCDMDKVEYIDLELAYVILVQHKSNSNLSFAIYLLKRNLWKEPKLKGTLVKPWRDQCEYEALCEGDDYWTHPKKLQKQVDILDNNPDCTLCYHACKVYVQNSSSWKSCNLNLVKEELSFDEIVVEYPFQTASVVYRKEIVTTDIYKNLNKIGLSCGDRILFMSAACIGNLKGVNEQMSVYRKNEGGLTSSIYNGQAPYKYVTGWMKVSSIVPYEKFHVIHRRRCFYLVYEYVITHYLNDFYNSLNLLLKECVMCPSFLLYIFKKMIK